MIEIYQSAIWNQPNIQTRCVKRKFQIWKREQREEVVTTAARADSRRKNSDMVARRGCLRASRA